MEQSFHSDDFVAGICGSNIDARASGGLIHADETLLICAARSMHNRWVATACRGWYHLTLLYGFSNLTQVSVLAML